MKQLPKKTIVLSAPIMIGVGRYEMHKISLSDALELIEYAQERNHFENFCGHETVRILGLEPVKERKTCEYYRDALVVVPSKRLEFGKEYSISEIEEIGYEIFHIRRRKSEIYTIEEHLEGK